MTWNTLFRDLEPLLALQSGQRSRYTHRARPCSTVVLTAAMFNAGPAWAMHQVLANDTRGMAVAWRGVAWHSAAWRGLVGLPFSGH